MIIKMKKGITLIALIITIVILIILAGTVIYSGTGMIKSVNLETVKTNLLLIQAKAKTIYEKLSFEVTAEELPNALTGQKVVAGSNEANELEHAGVVSTEVEKYYKWDSSVLEGEGLEGIEIEEGDYFYVNYEGEVEVVFPKGFTYTDGNTYYKLSELKELS